MGTLNSRLIILRQLDKKLLKHQQIQEFAPPPNGWLNAIRTVLNMSLKQLGSRLKMTAQGMKNLEEREKDGTITLNALRDAADGLGLKMVYGFVPKEGSLENMVSKKSQEMALEIVKRTSVTMKLEDQENSNERIQQSVNETAEQIKREMKKNLWD